MTRMRYVLLLALLVVFTGCHPGYGIYRHARVGFMPEPSCVGAVVRETPGVDQEQYRFAEGDRPLTWMDAHQVARPSSHLLLSRRLECGWVTAVRRGLQRQG